MTPRRFHAASIGPDEAALRAALQKCTDLLLACGCAAVGLAVHGKSNLNGVIRTVFGDDVVRVLDRDNKLDRKGGALHLLTEKIRVRKLNGPVIAAFVDPARLDKIVTCAGVTAVVFVPWTIEELQAYLQSHPASEEIYRARQLSGLVRDGR